MLPNIPITKIHNVFNSNYHLPNLFAWLYSLQIYFAFRFRRFIQFSHGNANFLNYRDGMDVYHLLRRSKAIHFTLTAESSTGKKIDDWLEEIEGQPFFHAVKFFFFSN